MIVKVIQIQEEKTNLDQLGVDSFSKWLTVLFLHFSTHYLYTISIYKPIFQNFQTCLNRNGLIFSHFFGCSRFPFGGQYIIHDQQPILPLLRISSRFAQSMSPSEKSWFQVGQAHGAGHCRRNNDEESGLYCLASCESLQSNMAPLDQPRDFGMTDGVLLWINWLLKFETFVTQANNVGRHKKQHPPFWSGFPALNQLYGCSKGLRTGVVYVEHAMEAVKTIVGKEGYLKDLVGNSVAPDVSWAFIWVLESSSQHATFGFTLYIQHPFIGHWANEWP